MASNTLPPAGLARRLAAMTYDFLVLLAISFVYSWIILTLKYQALKTPLPASGRAELGSIEGILLVGLLMLFYCFFWHRAGQTLGMRTWHLKLLNRQGERPSWPQCLSRCLLAPISLLALGLGYIWCIWDKDGKTWHDHLSATQVVILPHSKKK